MEPAAASPEELETLLEDALLFYDGAAVQALFEDGRVRVAGVSGALEGNSAGDLLADLGFLASGVSTRICADVAVGAGTAVTVSHRGADRRWRLLLVVVTGESPAAGSR
jgi:hypothetical protein